MSVASRTRATSSSGMPIGTDGTAWAPQPIPGRVRHGRTHRPAKRPAQRPAQAVRPQRAALDLDPAAPVGLDLALVRALAADRAPVSPARTAWAAASRAMGTRNGEQLT